MTNFKMIFAMLLLVATSASLAGCGEPDTPGEKLDAAIDNVGDAAENAGDNIEDATN